MDMTHFSRKIASFLYLPVPTTHVGHRNSVWIDSPEYWLELGSQNEIISISLSLGIRHRTQTSIPNKKIKVRVNLLLYLRASEQLRIGEAKRYKREGGMPLEKAALNEPLSYL